MKFKTLDIVGPRKYVEDTVLIDDEGMIAHAL